MRRALNAAIVLCEDRCIAPPGFIVEDQIVFDLAENQRQYLIEGLLQFPMRESNLSEFAEKKRVGYEPMRDRYSGLFSDTRIGFLGENATGIIGRRSQITERILEGWREGPESSQRIWKPVKGLLPSAQIDIISKIPLELHDRGTALTWSAIVPRLPPEARAAATELRDALQHIYFQQYCSEFKLVALTEIPHILRDFLLPRDEKVYSYRRLSAFLDVFELRGLILDAPASLLVALRKRPAFIEFIDAYAGLGAMYPGNSDLIYHAGRSRDAIKYDWTGLRGRQLSLFGGSEVEVSELASVCGEAGEKLAQEHGLRRRERVRPPEQRGTTKVKATMTAEPELVLFVALGEELDILARQLNLKKDSGTPEASGNLGGIAIDVVCPRNMGRVAAAVAMSTYLTRRNGPPKLILVVGIAGGFQENNSKVGHIVCVTKVVDLAIRKVVDDREGPSAKFRREDYPMHDALVRVIQSDHFDQNGWSTAALEFGWPSDRRPSIHYGPMASSDEVVSSEEWRKKMLEGQGGETKLLGVEMEAGGVCATGRRRDVPVCMLRVISDNADPSKADDQWRALGMKTLSALLLRLPLSEVLGQL